MAGKFEELVDQTINTRVPITNASLGTPAVLFVSQVVTHFTAAKAYQLLKSRNAAGLTALAGWALTPMTEKWISKPLSEAISASFGVLAADILFSATKTTVNTLHNLTGGKDIALPFALEGADEDGTAEYVVDENGNIRRISGKDETAEYAVDESGNIRRISGKDETAEYAVDESGNIRQISGAVSTPAIEEPLVFAEEARLPVNERLAYIY